MKIGSSKFIYRLHIRRCESKIRDVNILNYLVNKFLIECLKAEKGQRGNGTWKDITMDRLVIDGPETESNRCEI